MRVDKSNVAFYLVKAKFSSSYFAERFCKKCHLYQQKRGNLKWQSLLTDLHLNARSQHHTKKMEKSYHGFIIYFFWLRLFTIRNAKHHFHVHFFQRKKKWKEIIVVYVVYAPKKYLALKMRFWELRHFLTLLTYFQDDPFSWYRVFHLEIFSWWRWSEK